MATRSFIGGAQSAENVKRDFIEKPLNSAKQSLLETGLELFNLLSTLPDAFIGSQRRELQRVKQAAEKNDERVAALQESIVQATTLRTMIQRGDARVQRGLASMADSSDAFHGFVSNSELQPVGGLTVRLSGRDTGAGKKSLSATTDKDGYFRIPLGSKRDSGKEWRAKVASMSFSQRLDSMFEGSVNAAAPSDSTGATQLLAQVEILKDEKVIHTDQFGLPTDEGSVYREYVVAAEGSEVQKAKLDVADATVSEEQIDLKPRSAEQPTPKKPVATKPTKRASKK